MILLIRFVGIYNPELFMWENTSLHTLAVILFCLCANQLGLSDLSLVASSTSFYPSVNISINDVFNCSGVSRGRGLEYYFFSSLWSIMLTEVKLACRSNGCGKLPFTEVGSRLGAVKSWSCSWIMEPLPSLPTIVITVGIDLWSGNITAKGMS